jgi:hypothetical protein
MVSARRLRAHPAYKDMLLFWMALLARARQERGRACALEPLGATCAGMDSIPQDYPTPDEATGYAKRLSAVTGWHVVDRTGQARRPVLCLPTREHGQG